uniref:Uncharacterized protein n=1 Tax=Elaeophora elaphi TaxID=1147741 RepID=A0A0R3RL49_9BILA
MIHIYFSGRTEYQSMEEMRRRARVERTFLRHSNRQSHSTVNGNSASSRDYASSYRTTSPIIASRIFCMIDQYRSRSQICLRKWLGGRLRGVSPSSSSITTTGNTTGAGAAVASSIRTVDNSQQVTITGCTSSCSTLSPMSSIAASNGTSKFQHPETSSDTAAVADAGQEGSIDNNGDSSDKTESKISDSNVTEQRFHFTSFYAFYAFSFHFSNSL